MSSRSAPDTANEFDFLAGGGEMGALMRAHEWTESPLGTPEFWPQPLRTAVRLLLNTGHPMYIFWGQAGVCFYNDAYRQSIGPERHPSSLGQPARIVWEEIWPVIGPQIEQVMAGRGATWHENQLLPITRNGRLEDVYWTYSYSPIDDEAAKDGVGGVLVICTETTRALESAQRLADSETRLEQALSAGHGIGTWDWDVVKDQVFADARFARLYSVNPDTARVGAPLAEFFSGIHPEDAPRVQADIARTLKTGEMFSSEYRLIQPDGENRWVLAEGAATFNDAGAPVRMAGVTFDITERRSIREALRESEERYRALFERINTGFCIVRMIFDDQGAPVDYEFVEINPTFEAQTGLTGDVIGQRMRDLSPTHEQFWFDVYGEVARTGEPARFESGAEGLARWWDVHAYRIGEPADNLVAVLFNDISGRRAIEMRQAALIELDQELSRLIDPAEVVRTSSRLLAKALHAHRAGYGEVDAGAETIVVANDWFEPGGQSVAGTHHFRTYGSYISETSQGRPVTIENVRTDPRTAADPGPLLAYNVAALMDVPVMESDRMVAQVLVHSATPRAWTPDDIDLARAFAERTRSVVSRRKAEQESRSAELRQKALVDLNDAIRDLTNPEEIAHASSKILAEALDVSRVGYGVMDTVAETVTIERDYNAPGVQSIAGVIHFRDFGSYIENLSRGETVIFADAAHDPRVGDGGAALAGIKATSLINMPLMERGKVVALLFVNNARPREWSDEEVALVREVAERVRTASERARASAELLESEARYRTLFDTMDEGFCIIEFIDGPHGPLSDYIHVEANRAAAVQVGLADVAGRTIREIAPAEADTWVDLYKDVLKKGEPVRMERAFEATGRWLEVAAFPIEPASRNQAAVLFQDLTARKKAEIALRSSEENFRSLARAMPNQAWTATPDGMLDWFNRQVYDYFRTDEAALIGAGWIEFVHPDDIESAAARWRDALATGQPYQTEFRLQRADGVFRWHLARAEAIRSDTGEITRWVGTNTDINDQKEAAQALVDLNATLERRVEERSGQLMAAEEALRQSQKMEAVGQLTGGIAHDFNNLLAGISGSLELLAKRVAEGRTQSLDRYIASARDASQRAATLTQRLLAFSRRQTLDPRPVDLNRLIGGMEDLVRRTVGPGIKVEVVQAGGLWPTRIDDSQLENALLNLCINARDAMAPGGGRLTIETANKWLDDRAARERELAPGQYISLCVTDTGSGMSPEVIERAFDPFFTTKPLGQGTGLGLSMVYGFVRQSGGQVRIYSEVGEGTTMCLYLPRHFGEVPDEVGERQVANPDGGEGETVLVIDDEAILRMLMLDVLQENGYHALEAGDGPSALRILESDVKIDLLITDVGLPNGMNGRQVADQARLKRPDLKVLFVTGYAENAVVGNGHLAPGMELVTKPFEIAVFAQKVRDILDKGGK